MTQKFENTSWSSKIFIENYNEDSGEGYFLEVVVQYPEKFRLSSTYFFVMKILRQRLLEHITFNISSDIDFADFMNLYKKCTAKPYSFLVNDTTLASDNSLRFRKNLLGRT